MVATLEGKLEGESEGRLVVGVERQGERQRVEERVRAKERRIDEETEVEVEEDNIDPLVAPPLLAQPTPSLYYPPSLRLRFPTYRTPTTSRNSRNYPGHTHALSCVVPEKGLSKKRGKAWRSYSYVHHCLPRPILFLYFPPPPFVSYIFPHRREREIEKELEEERCRGHGGFVASFPKILRGPARVRKRHFIKNKFREGADGYPRASRGFHAADSLPHSLSFYLSMSHSLFLSPIHNSTRLSRLSRERYLDVLYFFLSFLLYCELVLTHALSLPSAECFLSPEFGFSH